jgi:DNA-binding NarL/FixJ family response regulator
VIVRPGPKPLTGRELLIVRLVTAGLNNREIAHAVGRTENGVKNAMKAILDKTGMGSRLELALWYLAKRNEIIAASDRAARGRA